MPVKINSSGGGSVTLDTPATGTNTTLTLPITGGTLVTTAGIPTPSTQYQVFSSSGTFTVPAGVTRIKVICVGGGGGGRSGTQQSCGCGGLIYSTGSPGGFGGAAAALINVTPGQSVTVTIGSGGAGNNSNGVGGSGGTTSFGALLSATGGTGGSSVGSINGTGPQGASGSPSAQNMWIGVAANSFSTGSRAVNSGAAAVTAVVTGSLLLVGAFGSGGTGSSGTLVNQVPAGGSGGAVYVEWIG